MNRWWADGNRQESKGDLCSVPALNLSGFQGRPLKCFEYVLSARNLQTAIEDGT